MYLIKEVLLNLNRSFRSTGGLYLVHISINRHKNWLINYSFKNILNKRPTVTAASKF